MEYIINAPSVQRWVQRHENGVCILTSNLDDVMIFKSYEDASDEVKKIGRSDLEINKHIYYEDIWFNKNDINGI